MSKLLHRESSAKEVAVEAQRDQDGEEARYGHPMGHPGMDVLEDAYLVSDPALAEKVSAALDEVAQSSGGTSVLIDRIFKTLTLSAGTVRVRDLGDMTWNDLLKVRMVIDALGKARSQNAVAALASLLNAGSDYGQFHEIVQPALAEALGEIGTQEAISALRDALARTDLHVKTTSAVQDALARVQPTVAAPADGVVDISKRVRTGKVGCIGFRLKDPAHRDSFGAEVAAALATAAGSTPTRVGAVFSHLETECTIEHPFVYDTSFAAAWPKVSGDLVLVTDFEDKWPQFEMKMRAQNYSGEPALLRAFAVNAKALELTVQLLSSTGEVIATL